MVPTTGAYPLLVFKSLLRDLGILISTELIINLPLFSMSFFIYFCLKLELEHKLFYYNINDS